MVYHNKKIYVVSTDELILVKKEVTKQDRPNNLENLFFSSIFGLLLLYSSLTRKFSSRRKNQRIFEVTKLKSKKTASMEKLTT